MIILLNIVAIVSVGWIIIFTANYFTHLEMIADEGKDSTWINFEEFKAVLNINKYYRTERFPKSLFSKNNLEDNIHADIICINGNLYKLYPWSYINFKLWEYNLRKMPLTDSNEAWYDYHASERLKRNISREEYIKYCNKEK